MISLWTCTIVAFCRRERRLAVKFLTLKMAKTVDKETVNSSILKFQSSKKQSVSKRFVSTFFNAHRCCPSIANANSAIRSSLLPWHSFQKCSSRFKSLSSAPKIKNFWLKLLTGLAALLQPGAELHVFVLARS